MQKSLLDFNIMQLKWQFLVAKVILFRLFKLFYP